MLVVVNRLEALFFIFSYSRSLPRVVYSIFLSLWNYGQISGSLLHWTRFFWFLLVDWPFFLFYFFSFFLSLFLFTLILLPCDFLSSMCHWHPFGSPPLPDVCVRQQPITNSSPVSPVWFCVGPSVSLAFSPLPPIVLNIYLFWNLTPEFIFIFPQHSPNPQKKRKQTAPLHFWFQPSISNPGFNRTVVWISYFWAHQNGGNALDYRYISSFLWKQLLAIFFSFLSDTNILFLIFLIDLPFFMTQNNVALFGHCSPREVDEI